MIFLSFLKELWLICYNAAKNAYILRTYCKLVSSLKSDYRTLKGQEAKASKVQYMYIIYFKAILTIVYSIVHFALYNQAGVLLIYSSSMVCTYWSESTGYPHLIYQIACVYLWGTLALTVNLWLFVQFSYTRDLLKAVIGVTDFNHYVGANPGSALKGLAAKTYGLALGASLTYKFMNNKLDVIYKDDVVDGVHNAVLKSREKLPKDSPLHSEPTIPSEDIVQIYKGQSPGALSSLRKWIFGDN